MKIAIPMVDGVLCSHFGQCRQFAIIEIDQDKQQIIAQETLIPPPHEPGAFPAWLSEMECNLIIAGGMGGRAINLFKQNGIQVIVGTPNSDPVSIVNDYLSNNLKQGTNMCGEPGFESGKTCEE